jgi:hypothetical protein
VSEMLKALEVITGEALGFEAVKKVVAQIRIVRTVFQEIVENYQNGMPHADEHVSCLGVLPGGGIGKPSSCSWCGSLPKPPAQESVSASDCLV